MVINARWRFADEGGRIRQGERGVSIQIGPKWVRFQELATGRRLLMRREIFEILKPTRLVTR